MPPKIFRIEQTLARRRAAPAPEREVADLHDLIAAQRRALSALIGSGMERRMTRAAGELGAAIDGMERGTHSILTSAEALADKTKALAAGLTSERERGLLQDIQDHVADIFEACNFQDLAGQRIGKVIAMLGGIEEQLAAMLAQCGGASSAAMTAQPAKGGLINGPKLDGDSGHATQHDIDAMFG